MRRSPRSLLACCAAVVVALVTVIVVGSDLRALHRRANDLGPLRSVSVAVRDLPLGATVTARDLRTTSRYESMIPPDAVVAREHVVGRVVAVPIAADAVVQGAHLADADRPGLTGLVPVGSRAMTVRTDDGLRPPRGAVVDVLAALDPAFSGAAAEGAVTVARAARVLAVDDGVDAQYAEPGTAGVTLLVTEEEAQSLAFAAANGVLVLALAPPEAACC
jgi:Flp pilus assembly protein CpaB